MILISLGKMFEHEASSKSGVAMKGMIAVFVVAILVFMILYVNLVRILRRMLVQMEEIVALLFMLPPEVTKKQPIIKRCIESGGASFLEEEV
jgi:hypothetical protein